MLEATARSDTAFGLVSSGFLRVVTHPRVFDPPTPLEDALLFVEGLRARPNCAPRSRSLEETLDPPAMRQIRGYFDAPVAADYQVF